jgi:hypothetical protein
VKKKAAQLHAEWIVSEWASRTVFSLLIQGRFLLAHQLVSTPLVKKPKDHTVSAEGINHVCIN